MPSPSLAILQRQRKPHLHHIPFGSSTSQNGNVGVVICGTPRLFFLPCKRKFFGTRAEKNQAGKRIWGPFGHPIS